MNIIERKRERDNKTKRQRDKERQRDNKTKRQRQKERKRQKETIRQREEERKREREKNNTTNLWLPDTDTPSYFNFRFNYIH